MESLTTFNQRNKSQTTLLLKGIQLEREENQKIERQQRRQFVKNLKDKSVESRKKFKNDFDTFKKESAQNRLEAQKALKTTYQELKKSLDAQAKLRTKAIQNQKNLTLQNLIDCVEKHRESSAKAFEERLNFINQLSQETKNLLKTYQQERLKLRKSLFNQPEPPKKPKT